MMRFFSYSLSLRLLAIFLLLAALFAWGVVAGIRWAYSADDLRTLISGHLSLHVDYVRQDIGSPPRLDRALAITRKVPVDIHISGPGVNWSSDPAFPDPATLQFGPSDYFSAEPSALLDELRGVEFAVRDNHRYFRFNEGGYEIVVVTPKIADHHTRPPLVPILVGFALLLVLLAYLAVRGLFRPIATIRQGAAYIGAGHFGHRIKTRRDDELGELAEDINLMAGKVEGMLDAKRELLLGVSHELRSPISRMTLGLALLDESPSVRALQQDVGRNALHRRDAAGCRTTGIKPCGAAGHGCVAGGTGARPAIPLLRRRAPLAGHGDRRTTRATGCNAHPADAQEPGGQRAALFHAR